MNASDSIRDSAIFSQDSVTWILDWLDDITKRSVLQLVEEIRNAWRDWNIWEVRMAWKVLWISMRSSYWDKWPNWAFRLWQYISQLENRMQTSWVSAIRQNVASAIPQAATWPTEADFTRWARVVDIDEWLQAATPWDPRSVGIAATSWSWDDLGPRGRL